jgi:hypothetical protein
MDESVKQQQKDVAVAQEADDPASVNTARQLNMNEVEDYDSENEASIVTEP